MNNDPTALQERIARAFWEYEAGPSGMPWERFAVRCPEVAAERMRNAAPVLPIIAAEVRAAKAEALREAAENVDVGSLADAWTRGGITRLSVTNAVAEVLMSLRSRATEYEKDAP